MPLQPEIREEERDGQRGWYIGLRLSLTWEQAAAWLKKITAKLTRKS